MYINFQQNRVGRSVKTVHTNLFAKNRKLHESANSLLYLNNSTLSTLLEQTPMLNRVMSRYNKVVDADCIKS